MAKKKTIQNVIDALEEAMDAAESMNDGTVSKDTHKDAVITAINQIRRGEYTEAITTLEREFLPKWESRAACEAEYRRAVADNATRNGVAA